MSQQGQLKFTDFWNNVGGLNLRDTPVRVTDEQATGGINFDYVQTGGIKSRRGEDEINSSANTQLKSLGLSTYLDAAGARFLVRAAGTKYQNVDLSTPSFTNLSEDTTTAGTDFISSSSTQPVVTSQFNGSSASILWLAGGGASTVYGIYSTAKVTANGVPAPTNSSFTAVAGGSGSTLSTGTYRYTLVYKKNSTDALSNAGGEASVSVTAGEEVTLAWTLTNNDTTKYDAIYVYRSALNGAAAFTTGDLVTILASSATGYVDTGSSTASSQNIPRAGNALLDNSQLPSGTYITIRTWKRRLVTANESTLYISDLNKSESWPTANTITIPSGGPITGLAIISFATEQNNDEYLAIFKEREVWILTGDDVDDWALKFVDNTGCPGQSLIVNCNGFLAFVDYRGIFLWDGSNKPIYTSGPLEPLFAVDGDIDKSKLAMGFGTFFRKKNEVEWVLSNNVYGDNLYCLKMDLRLTLPSVQNNLMGRVIDGVFTQDQLTQPMYAGTSYLPATSFEEALIRGDDAGHIYSSYSVFADAGEAYSFQYFTKFLDLGTPMVEKRFHKVIVWVEEIGDWDLLLDYWTSYRSGLDSKDTLSEKISTAEGGLSALWEVGVWDRSFWDDYTAKLRPLVFNLRPGLENSNEGDVIRLRFRQDGANQPVTINGFTVVWSEKGFGK